MRACMPVSVCMFVYLCVWLSLTVNLNLTDYLPVTMSTQFSKVISKYKNCHQPETVTSFVSSVSVLCFVISPHHLIEITSQ